MKIIKLNVISIVFLYFVLITLFGFVRNRRNKNYSMKLLKNNKFSSKNNDPGIFKDPSLQINERKERLLTDEAISNAFSAFNIAQIDILNCLNSLSMETKSSILSFIIRVSKQGVVNDEDKAKIDSTFTCPNLNNFSSYLNDSSNINKIGGVVKNFTRKMRKYLKR
jgi:hypothetical protein